MLSVTASSLCSFVAFTALQYPVQCTRKGNVLRPNSLFVWRCACTSEVLSTYTVGCPNSSLALAAAVRLRHYYPRVVPQRTHSHNVFPGRKGYMCRCAPALQLNSAKRNKKKIHRIHGAHCGNLYNHGTPADLLHVLLDSLGTSSLSCLTEPLTCVSNDGNRKACTCAGQYGLACLVLRNALSILLVLCRSPWPSNHHPNNRNNAMISTGTVASLSRFSRQRSCWQRSAQVMLKRLRGYRTLLVVPS